MNVGVFFLVIGVIAAYIGLMFGTGLLIAKLDDRLGYPRGGLVVFGVWVILIAAIAACLVPNG